MIVAQALPPNVQEFCENRELGYARVMPQCQKRDDAPAVEIPRDPGWLDKALAAYCRALGGTLIWSDRCLWTGNLFGGGPQ